MKRGDRIRPKKSGFVEGKNPGHEMAWSRFLPLSPAKEFIFIGRQLFNQHCFPSNFDFDAQNMVVLQPVNPSRTMKRTLWKGATRLAISTTDFNKFFGYQLSS